MNDWVTSDGWRPVSQDEAQDARDAGKRVKFTITGWMVEGGDADGGADLERHEPRPPDTTAAVDLAQEAAAVFGDMIYHDMSEEVSEMESLKQRTAPSSPLPMIRKDGEYVVAWKECECGEQYVVKSEHERMSARHKKWARGGNEIEIPVPPQPLYGAYPVGRPTPPLEVGVNKICERCGARDKKGLDYYPDKDSKPERRFPCRRCNGHGIRPNVGPA